jgi:hypothetical protein
MPGCLGNEVKVKGRNGKIDFSSVDGGTQSSFKFNFAYHATVSDTTFYMQGTSNSKSGSIGTCNLAGTGCVCEFLDSNSAVLYTTSSSQISYDERGNYYRCTYAGSSAIANVSTVRIKNNSGTVTSEKMSVYLPSTLSLPVLMGTEVDINRVRSIARYACVFNFLQKYGTTTQGFDCTSQPVSCDPDGTVTKNFCLLQASFPYYLYSDYYATNFWEKLADKVYNGGGTDKICGLQIKQVDCTGAGGTPSVKFGLYGEQTGMWDTSVSLASGPDQLATNYGYAARTSASTTECPPGLEKRVFFKTTVVTSDITPGHNFTSGLIATEVNVSTVTPAAFPIDKYGGGGCTGTAGCTLPNSYAGLAKASQAYSSAGQTEFCVIPSTYLQ